MKYALIIAALFSLTVLLLHAQEGCVILPIKPIPPIGCRDLAPQCVCDADGHDCHIEWVCVPY